MGKEPSEQVLEFVICLLFLLVGGRFPEKNQVYCSGKREKKWFCTTKWGKTEKTLHLLNLEGNLKKTIKICN